MSKKIDPAMHSAEHILNQTMDRLFNCGRCFSAHIERKKSKCDYHFDRSLTEDEVRTIESHVNAVIREGLPVTESWIPLIQAKGIYHLERLPANVGGDIRLVKIGDYDTCPCIGVHVRTTHEIGHFRITTTSYDAGVLRIRFKLTRS